MAKRKTKKMTISYWNALSQDSKKRALTYVFPIHPECVKMLLKQKPKVNNPWWQMVWDKVRIPEDNSHYKVVINKETYIC